MAEPIDTEAADGETDGEADWALADLLRVVDILAEGRWATTGRFVILTKDLTEQQVGWLDSLTVEPPARTEGRP